jgi:hypothetical protein
VAKPATASGGAPRSITASRYFRCGANIALRRGRSLLGYWGLPNLQVINRDSHVAQCATEARGRHASRPPVLRQAAGLFQNGLSSSGGRRVTSKLAERKLVECDCGWSPTACHCRGIGK